jgi:hypothetical protein
MSKNPDKTVFEGKHLKSFTVKEDNAPLLEGSAAGIRRYASTVPEHAMTMAPQISQFMMNRQTARALDKLDDGKANGSAPVQYFNIPEPFQVFNVELHFDHPYWTVIKCDMEGPRFSNELPDVNDYLRDYNRSIEEIKKYKSLMEEGIITQQEFDAKKKQLLGI